MSIRDVFNENLEVGISYPVNGNTHILLRTQGKFYLINIGSFSCFEFDSLDNLEKYINDHSNALASISRIPISKPQ